MLTEPKFENITPDSSNSIPFNEAINKSKVWIVKKNEELLTSFKEANKWTQLAWGATALEFAFARAPLISMPAVVLDVGGGFGNLLQKLHSGKVKASDVTGMGSSLVSFAGGFAMAASLGIEATIIGAKLVRIASLATPLGIGLLAVGYAIDHHEDLKEYLGEGYDLLKEQYSIAAEKFQESRLALQAHMGEPLLNAISEGEQANIGKIFANTTDGKLTYNFDYLDPTGALKLKENLHIEPTDLYKFLNELNTEQQAEMLESLGQELEMALNIEKLNAVSLAVETQLDSSLHNLLDVTILDLPENNLSLLFLDRKSFESSGLFSFQPLGNGVLIDYVPNQQYSWVNNGLKIFNAKGDLIYYDPIGEQRALSFPLILDEVTGKLLSVPLNHDASYNRESSFDIILNEPQLFNTPSHISFNNAHNLAQHFAQLNMMMEGGRNSHLQHLNMVQHRLAMHHRLKYDDVFKSKDALDLKLNTIGQSDFSKLDSAANGSGSSNSTEGTIQDNKLCHGGSSVHICFNMTQNLLDMVDSSDPVWYATSF
jgi:hypothetical protein